MMVLARTQLIGGIFPSSTAMESRNPNGTRMQWVFLIGITRSFSSYWAQSKNTYSISEEGQSSSGQGSTHVGWLGCNESLHILKKIRRVQFFWLWGPGRTSSIWLEKCRVDPSKSSVSVAFIYWRKEVSAGLYWGPTAQRVNIAAKLHGDAGWDDWDAARGKQDTMWRG